nr:ribonuclease TUDOR 1-like [Tanacetum cinerariifolium]
EEANTSINAMMLKAGLARLDVRRRWEPRRQGVLDDLEKYESEARTNRYGIWKYGNIPMKKPGAG